MLKRVAVRVLPHWVYRIVRARRIARMVSNYEPRVVEHDYGPHRLKVNIADPLGEGWYDRDWPELSELAKLRELGALRRGARIFDLGAHQAVVALMLAAEVGEDGQVFAVEAEPHNAAVARRNADLNSAHALTVINAAAADRAGSTLSFAEGLNGQVDEGTRLGNVQVRSVTVDGLAAEHGAPDVVFVDVEGYEGKVLAGAERTLAQRQATFLVEVHVGSLVDCEPQDVIAAFPDGYSILIASEGGENGAGDEWRGFPSATIPDGRFYVLATPDSTPAA